MLYSLEGDDEKYLTVADKYDHSRPEGQRAVDLYSRAFGELQCGVSETDRELLGVVYEELGVDSDAFGQYFTPHSLCDVKAALTIDTEDQRDEPYMVADPTSGSGRLLVAAARYLPEEAEAVYFGQDKDVTCAKMTALNLCFFNLDGYAVHGDSLQLEANRVWATQRTPRGGTIRELEEDEFLRVNYQALKAEVEAGDTNVDVVGLEESWSQVDAGE